MSDTRSQVNATNADDALEFELVDIERARAAHDEIPPGVGTLPTPPAVWEAQRRKPGPIDRALAGITIDWMISLPAPVRPYALCEQYPRVTNALAAAWGDPVKRRALLDDLVLDRRGRRTGFPDAVRMEIETLRYSISVTNLES